MNPGKEHAYEFNKKKMLPHYDSMVISKTYFNLKIYVGWYIC